MAVELSRIPVSQSSRIYNYVESITLYHFEGTDTIRFYPEGRFELLFQFGSKFLHRSRRDDSWILRPSAFIGGLHDRAYHVKPLARKAQCLGLKFKPDAAKHFIPTSLHHLINRVISLSDLWGDASCELLNAILKSKDIKKAVHLIEHILLTHFDATNHSPIQASCLQIIHRPGTFCIHNLAKFASLSESHFRKRFNEEIGLSPKHFAKIIRVNQAIERLQNRTFSSLTTLAFDLGYYDQAHFIREFKSVTELTPGQFLHKSA